MALLSKIYPCNLLGNVWKILATFLSQNVVALFRRHFRIKLLFRLSEFGADCLSFKFSNSCFFSSLAFVVVVVVVVVVVAKDLKDFAKVAKLRQIWSHCLPISMKNERVGMSF